MKNKSIRAALRNLFLTTLLVLSFLTTASALETPAVFNSSPSAKPGEVINLQGEFSAAATASLKTAADEFTDSIDLTVVVQSSGQMTVKIPTSLTLDLYRITVTDDDGSCEVYVNQTMAMQIDSSHLYPGCSLRIFGRNLKLPGGTSTVRFQPVGGGSPLTSTADANASDAYKLKLTAPSLVANTVYDVYVSNGRGGTASESKLEKQVTGIAQATDPFNLEVPWGHKFAFSALPIDVTTKGAIPDDAIDDGPAIRAAIQQAYINGGGVVYIPAGHYRIDTVRTEIDEHDPGYRLDDKYAMTIKDKVVVQGAGIDVTFLEYGHTTPPMDYGYGIAFSGSQPMGLCDMTITNVNTNGNWLHNLIAAADTNDLFLARIKYNYSGEALVFPFKSKRTLIKDCILHSRYLPSLGGNNQGPLTVFNTDEMTLAGNHITHEIGQSSFNLKNTNLLMEDNVFEREADRVDLLMDTRTMSINFATNVAIINNEFRTLNGPAYYHVDGETILSEGGGAYGQRKECYYGAVVSASGTSLTLDGLDLKPEIKTDAIIVIIYGKGRGQWSHIASRDSNHSITVAQPWKVLPDSTSRYSITNWSAMNWLVQGNQMIDNRAGLELYAASGNHLAFVGNTLTNNDGILLRTAHTPEHDPNPVESERGPDDQVFNVIYNAQVVGNTVIHDSQMYDHIPAYIGVLALQTETVSLGTHTIGVEIRDNTVQGLPGYHPITPYEHEHDEIAYPNNNSVNTEGYYNRYLNEFFSPGTSHFGHNQGIEINLGAIFQGNSALNCDPVIYLDTAAFNTVLSNTNTNGAELWDDHHTGDATIGSTRTVDLDSEGPLLEPETPTATDFGLEYKYYEGTWTQIPDFLRLASSESGTCPNFSVSSTPRAENFAMKFTGYITVPTDGMYTFYTTSDDGSKLYIGSTQVVDNDGLHPLVERSGTIGLQAGTHPITVTFLQAQGGKFLEVKYQGPAISKQTIPNSALTRLSDATPVNLRVRYYPRQGCNTRMEGGIFQGSNDGLTWIDLGTIDGIPPTAWSELSLGSTVYRYLRYAAPDNSFGNIAELEFYNGNRRLGGAGFGTPGSYQNGPDTFDKALDGDINTSYDAFYSDDAFVGIDQGL